MDVDLATSQTASVLEAVESAVIAKRSFLETVLTGVVGGGHVLLEDVPGTGKTLAARSLAGALDLSFTRIQFTPDLLPADITGSNVFDERSGEFTFAEGPIFANIVLADEINRAPPKTQAALLEAMGEGQVSADGETFSLPDPFIVIATQNPVEQEGTFGLPEAQRDRFMVKTSMGYPERDGELELVNRRADRSASIPTVSSVVDGEEVTDLRTVPESVTVDPKVRAYLVDLGRATRDHSEVEVGVSPRGIQHIFEAARAYAVVRGRGYVVPDDVKRLLEPVFAHRLVLTTEAEINETEPADVLAEVAQRVDVPSMDV
ncbi:AAA family ATPase [Halobaculum lipolyticum]|uniref:AAA family ATPase n=1 Tax=Halobaculum lipolyticum TaxID=3032001 RepID=A0ABD5WJ19_9EURY|nr:MoxR family ATPase [Halobaculum sp. DT31]